MFKQVPLLRLPHLIASIWTQFFCLSYYLKRWMQCFLRHIITMLRSKRHSQCSFTSMLSISLSRINPHLQSMASNLCKSASFLLDPKHGRGTFFGYAIMVFHCYSLTILLLLHIEKKDFADHLFLRDSLSSSLKLLNEGS
jgi:hypothetical protein